MARMGAACVASAGTGMRTGSAASMTMMPVVPDYSRYPTGRDLADTKGELGQGYRAEGVAMEDQPPAELVLVEVDRAAAGDASHDANARRGTVRQVEFLAQGLVTSDQRRGREAHETERIRDASGLVQLDHRLVHGDVEAALAHTGIDDAEPPAHALNPRRPGS